MQPCIDLGLRKFTLRNNLTSNIDIERVDGSDELDGIETHMLLENTNNKTTICYLCAIIDQTSRSRWTSYECSEFQNSCHVHCFTIFYRRKDVEGRKKDVYCSMMKAELSLKGRITRN